MNLFPLVSVVTPSFNAEKFIKRVVVSVSHQNVALEHIIVDDCSSDNSWPLLRKLSNDYSWLSVYRLDQNSGPIVARNRAIDLAKGRFLAFLDVDDFWLPHKLETQLKFMIENDCALSFTDYRFVSVDGKRIGRSLHGFNKIGWHLHHITRYLGCLTIIIDRQKIPNFRFADVSPAIRAEDFLAWSHCIQKYGPALRCPHDLARYSVVPNSRSSNVISVSVSVWNLYRYIEGISLFMSAFYFICYAVGVVWKRLWYRPRLHRGAVDNDYSWSILD